MDKEGRIKFLTRGFVLNNILFVTTLGRRQAVRHLVLVQAFRGSNPFAPE